MAAPPAPCTFAGEQAPCGQIFRTSDRGPTFGAIGAPRLLGQPLSDLESEEKLRAVTNADGSVFARFG